MRPSEEYYQHHQLETIRMGMRQYLSDEFISRVNVEVAERALYELGNSVGYNFKASIWADKLADDVHQETTQVTVDIPTDQWESAWQLWKHNHQDSRLLGWIARRWPPQKTGIETFSKTKTATLEFRVCKYHTFPDFNPETYPNQFGKYYRYVKQDRLALRWDD